MRKYRYMIDVDPITDASVLIKGYKMENFFIPKKVLMESENVQFMDSQFYVKNGILIDTFQGGNVEKIYIDDEDLLFDDKKLAELYFLLNFKN